MSVNNKFGIKIVAANLEPETMIKKVIYGIKYDHT